MSVDATRWAWGVDVNSSTKRLVLLSLADRAGEEHTCYPSTKRVMKDTCLDRKTILKAITDMISDGLIFDTGDRKGNGVRVLKLIGVNARENESHPKKVTDPKIGTSTEIGITTDPKNGITTDPKIGTQNLKGNLKKNLTGKGAVMREALIERNAKSDLISEWIDFRVKSKATDTERAVSMFFTQVEKSGLNLNTVLNICVTRGWKGFEAGYLKSINPEDYLVEENKIEQQPEQPQRQYKPKPKKYLEMEL